jgi:hypothetical protein
LNCSTLDISLAHNFSDYNLFELFLDNTDNSKKAFLSSTYRNGTPETAAKYDSSFIKIMHHIENLLHAYSIVIGDFNFSILKWDPDPIVPDNLDDGSIGNQFLEAVRDAFN